MTQSNSCRESEKNCSFHIIGNHYMPNNIPISNIYGTQLLPAYITGGTPEPCSNDEELETIFFEGEDEDEVYYLLEQKEDSAKPEASNEEFKESHIEYHTEGILRFSDKEGTVIEYGDYPVKIQIFESGVVMLSSENSLVSQLVFEKGKRTSVSAKSSGFFSLILASLGNDPHINVITHDIKNKLTKDGGSLSIDFTVEIGCLGSERTSFTLFAG